jgi:hypothetical protein
MYQCTRERQESFNSPCEIDIAISRRADPRDLLFDPQFFVNFALHREIEDARWRDRLR